MNFTQAVQIILLHEGGLVNHPNDPGGITKYGISKRTYPQIDIKNLTEKEAIKIYYTDYWERVACDLMPKEIRLMLFDCAVNQGQSKAIKIIQSCLAIPADGKIGQQTLSAANNTDPLKLLKSIALKRHSEYSKLPTFIHFGAGWTRRLLDISFKSLCTEA